jgi:opacity protein-like surface antigen
MKRLGIKLSLAALSILTGAAIMLTLPAAAADIYGGNSGYTTPADDRAAVRWTEVYAGISVGYGQSHREYNVDVDHGEEAEVEAATYNLLNLSGISSMGAAVSSELGFNYLLPNSRIVAGVHGGYEYVPDWNSELSIANGAFTAELKRGDSWYVGGNLGYLVNDFTHVYGLARWVNQEGSELEFTGGSFKFDDRQGLGLGLGVSTAVTELIKLRLEYAHNFFDDETVFSNEDITVTEGVDEDIIKIGATVSLF